MMELKHESKYARFDLVLPSLNSSGARISQSSPDLNLSSYTHSDDNEENDQKQSLENENNQVSDQGNETPNEKEKEQERQKEKSKPKQKEKEKDKHKDRGQHQEVPESIIAQKLRKSLSKLMPKSSIPSSMDNSTYNSNNTSNNNSNHNSNRNSGVHHFSEFSGEKLTYSNKDDDRKIRSHSASIGSASSIGSLGNLGSISISIDIPINNRSLIVCDKVIFAFELLYRKYIDPKNAVFMINISANNRKVIMSLFDRTYNDDDHNNNHNDPHNSKRSYHKMVFIKRLLKNECKRNPHYLEKDLLKWLLARLIINVEKSVYEISSIMHDSISRFENEKAQLVADITETSIA